MNEIMRFIEQIGYTKSHFYRYWSCCRIVTAFIVL